ncbi:hypothetical protein TeGR_g14974 [Tetraparma gracilis]|uniref:Uncharacterized protein n=1 Tax=Tetraparma gracilis TaxID=2962635 RepID=A0ABQ6MYW3_9STRA|nr:hypothetical protein TeGR_g14974 [Tetraparma gracilis]
MLSKTLLAALLLPLAAAQQLLSVPLVVDGRDLALTLNQGENVLQAAARTVESYQLGDVFGPDGQVSELTRQLAAVLEQQIPKEPQRNVVFTTVVEINNQKMELGVAEGEDALTATTFFCRQLDLNEANMGVCLQGLVSTVEQRMVSFMQERQRQQAAAQAPLFELPMQVGDRVLPLAFTLSEHPRDTAARFCDAEWGYISTVLRAEDASAPVDKELCGATLFSLVVGVVDELLGSERGLALAAEQRAFKIDVELTPEPGTPARQQTIDLNVFPGQTPDVAVDNFLRRTGIGQAARPQLVELVASQM